MINSNTNELIKALYVIKRLVDQRRYYKLIRPIVNLFQNSTRVQWGQHMGTSKKVDQYWDLPLIQQTNNKLISGDEKKFYGEYIYKKYLCNPSVMSLGVGLGGKLKSWSKIGNYKEIVGYDLSPERIASASSNVSDCQFKVGDFHDTDIYKEKRDAIIWEHSLHHVKELEHVRDCCHTALYPNGHLILNDYFGPTQFQYSYDRSILLHNLLHKIPSSLRKRISNPHAIKTNVEVPSKTLLRLNDPSEAVRSGEIIPLFLEKFNIVECKAQLGTLLYPLLYDIAGHFTEGDGFEILEQFIDLEIELINCGSMGVDFSVLVMEPK